MTLAMFFVTSAKKGKTMIDDPEKMTDDERAEAGIPTDYTVENLCCECGNDLGDDFAEVEGALYGRPAVTVAVHSACLTDENVLVDEEQPKIKFGPYLTEYYADFKDND